MHESRYRFIQIRPGIRAVVDSATGAYYGLTEYQGSVWGARDWAGMSLSPFFTESRVPAAASTHEWWADRLIERADRAKGLPVPEDPETAQGLYEELLYIGGGESFNVYTELGRYLGVVVRTQKGDWIPCDKFDNTNSPASTRTEAAEWLKQEGVFSPDDKEG